MFYYFSLYIIFSGSEDGFDAGESGGREDEGRRTIAGTVELSIDVGLRIYEIQ